MIIGICGQSGSGKDTVADHLIANHKFVRLSFADPMKRFVQELFDFSHDQIWGPSQTRNAFDQRYLRVSGECLTPRFALQTLGTEWGRSCYPNIWVDYAMRIAKKIEGGSYSYSQQRGLGARVVLDDCRTNIVISDVRFRNEVDGIKNAGGKIFKIIRPGYVGDVGLVGHASEEEQKTLPNDIFDAIICNNSTLSDLFVVVDAALKANQVIK